MRLPNDRAALDAAIAFCFHFVRHWRGASEHERCVRMPVALQRLLPAACAVVSLTSGCACRDGFTEPRTVALCVQPSGTTATLTTKAYGKEKEIKPDGTGVYRVEIPSMVWADNLWFGFISVPTRTDDTRPFLYVTKADGTASHLSARQLARLPVDTNGTCILKVRR